MHIAHHLTTIKRTVHIYQNEPKKPKTGWLLLHGHGQTGERFLKKFAPWHNDDTLLLSPEAFNYFYLPAKPYKVGATWMTKHNRQYEINDYLAYLQQVLTQATENYSHIKQWNILGFSQGAATAVRFFLDSTHLFSNLVLYCGYFPPDMAFDTMYYKSGKTNIIEVLAKNDPFISKTLKQEKQSTQDKLALKQPINVIEFEGSHAILPEILNKIQASIK